MLKYLSVIIFLCAGKMQRQYFWFLYGEMKRKLIVAVWSAPRSAGWRHRVGDVSSVWKKVLFFPISHLAAVHRCARSHWSFSPAPSVHAAFNPRYDCWTSALASQGRLESPRYRAALSLSTPHHLAHPPQLSLPVKAFSSCISKIRILITSKSIFTEKRRLQTQRNGAHLQPPAY